MPSKSSARATIFVAGEVNSGKSSFINAIAGGIVSNVSIQRETFNPIWYQFSDTGTEGNLRTISEGLEDVHTQNVGQRKSLASLKEEDVSTFLKITAPTDVHAHTSRTHRTFVKQILCDAIIISFVDSTCCFSSTMELDQHVTDRFCQATV